jgi:hypothetical protein
MELSPPVQEFIERSKNNEEIYINFEKYTNHVLLFGIDNNYPDYIPIINGKFVCPIINGYSLTTAGKTTEEMNRFIKYVESRYSNKKQFYGTPLDEIKITNPNFVLMPDNEMRKICSYLTMKKSIRNINIRNLEQSGYI